MPTLRSIRRNLCSRYRPRRRHDMLWSSSLVVCSRFLHRKDNHNHNLPHHKLRIGILHRLNIDDSIFSRSCILLGPRLHTCCIRS